MATDGLIGMNSDLYADAQPGWDRSLQPDGSALSQAGSTMVFGGGDCKIMQSTPPNTNLEQDG
jgi:hypothetical protein